MLSFITNRKIWNLISFFIKFYLVFFYRIKVGKNFYSESFPVITTKGLSKNIVIGNNVKFLGIIDLRNRENGKIIIKDDVIIEGYSRFVAAREGAIIIGEKTHIGGFANWNGGGRIEIGKKCIFAQRSSLQSSSHNFISKLDVMDQGYTHGNIIVGDDCFFGTSVLVKENVNIKKGSIIGANSVVVKDTTIESVNAGVPAKEIRKR
jgi:acetyltransferase-like isoleucine patch superfamily enzyme